MRATSALLRRLLTIVALTAMVVSGLTEVGRVPAAQADTAKAPLSGVVDRNGKPVLAWASVVNNYVVRVTWAELQTSQGGAIAASNKINTAITAVRNYNASHSPPEAIKVRIDAGTGAPDWAKNLDGSNTAVAVHDAQDSNSPDTTPDTVGRFWEPAFGTAYNDFQSKLATLYDGTPEIRDVTISRCTLSTVEPFLRTASSQHTKDNLLAAGYTVALDKACQTAQIDEAKAVWLNTPSSLALNPYQVINADGTDNTDGSYTESMITYCRNTLGSLCVLENNSLRDPLQGGQYTSMYSAIQAAGAAGSPITFQTASSGSIGSLCRTLDSAVRMGANSVEIPGQYSDPTKNPDITLSGLSSYDKALERVQPADAAAPSAPANLKATINSSSVSLTWQTATDTGYGVACYTVKRNGTFLGTTMATSFTDTSPNTTPPTRYTVAANDGAGNVGPEASVSITPPITTVSASRSTITYGSPVTFTATVTSQDGGTPTGTVKFFDGPNELGSPALGSTGRAQLTTSSLTAGSHSITAVYQGDSTFLPSSSDPITETVSKAASSTAVAGSPNPSNYGGPVTITATVSGPGGPPTGNVEFFDGSMSLGTASLSGGHAQMPTSTLPIGRHTITAHYNGDANFNASSRTYTQTVGKGATSTALGSSPNPASYGSSVTFTATVTSTAGDTPTGSVTFKNGSSSLGTVTLNGSGQATLTTNKFTKVSNSITAVYGGSTIFLASTSPVLTQPFTGAPSSISLVSSRNPQTSPNPVNFTATVTSPAGTPTGSVTFYEGSTSLGPPATITSGRAILTGIVLPPGGHLITAHYNGDANFAPSPTSKVLFQRINRTGAASSTARFAPSSANPSTSGQTVTLKVNVTGSGGPTGTVYFFDGGTLLGPANLDGVGQAILPWTFTATGRHLLTAGYEGDSVSNPAISSTFTQTVNP